DATQPFLAELRALFAQVRDQLAHERGGGLERGLAVGEDRLKDAHGTHPLEATAHQCIPARRPLCSRRPRTRAEAGWAVRTGSSGLSTGREVVRIAWESRASDRAERLSRRTQHYGASGGIAKGNTPRFACRTRGYAPSTPPVQQQRNIAGYTDFSTRSGELP